MTIKADYVILPKNGGKKHEYNNNATKQNKRYCLYRDFRRTDCHLLVDFHSHNRPLHFADDGCFTAVGLLGGKRGSLAVLVYILLGLVGLPVFAGFSGGVGVLFGTTGGYIIGFLASALLMWGIETVCGRGKIVLAVSMVLGLVVCYAIGTLWFMVVYAKTSGAVGLGTVLGWCVIPFIIPDLIKIGIALLLTERFRKVIA